MRLTGIGLIVVARCGGVKPGERGAREGTRPAVDTDNTFTYIIYYACVLHQMDGAQMWTMDATAEAASVAD